MPERQLVRRRFRSDADVAEIERVGDAGALLPAETILGCLRAAAAPHPEKPAIVLVEPPDFSTPTRELAYADLVSAVERSAALFSASAGDSPSVVAVMLPMVPEGLTALWGAQTSGTAVPLNPFLETHSLLGILTATSATALVTTRQIVEEKGGAERIVESVPTLRAVYLVDDDGSPSDLATALDALDVAPAMTPDPDPWRDSVVMPTGGTTGTPKLVRMSQAAQLRVAWNVGGLMGNEPDTVTAHGMPNFHCGGAISLGLRTLLFGGTLLTLTRHGFRSREVLSAFWDIARRYRVTSLLATPTTALALLHGDGSSRDCVIRDFHCGGSALPIDLVDGFHERFGIWLRENWGMTELHGTTTGHYDHLSKPRVGSAGRPLPFVRVKAVELDGTGRWVRDCAPGERGVLLTGTPTATAGYLDSRLDRDYFPSGLPDDLPDGWRWGNTGDLGSVDEDGYVWVFGRVKDLIIRGGHNIDPKEIEDALGRHPAVHVAAAVGRPDRAKGELPVAYVELVEPGAASADELVAFCRAEVAEQAAAPVAVTIVDKMPLTAVGKVAKPVLRERALKAEVERVLATTLGDQQVAVALDSSGRRQQVQVVLPCAIDDDLTVRAVRDALVGYEFGVSVSVAG